MSKRSFRSKIRINEPWEAYLDTEVEVLIYLYDESDHFLVEFEQPIRIADDDIQYLVGRPRKVKSLSFETMVRKKVDCSFIKTTVEKVKSLNPVDVSWWRGGAAFFGSIELI